MLFGTDGVRGVANADLTPELAFRLGRAAAAVLGGQGGRPRFAVGRDTRLSGHLLQSALTAGLLSAGADVVDLGVITTPGVAYLVRRMGCQGGAVVSASHNPAEYNGIKMFSGQGFKFPDEVEARIEDLALSSDSGLPRPVGAGIGRLEDGEGWRETYLDYLARTIPGPLPSGRVIVDCAHGATSELAPGLLRRAGAEVVALHTEPDGLNINAGCGSTSPQVLAEAVSAEGAFCGIAYDGDGDRAIAVDERGRVVDGDAIMGILALSWRERGRLQGGAVVATVMSNLGLEVFLRQAGVGMIRTPVGDRHVLEQMLRGGHNLGGEQSGHIILLDYATTGDGMLTALQFLWTIGESGRPLSALAGAIPRFPQILRNVPLPEGGKYRPTPAVSKALEEAARILGEQGRVLVRPSGTEPLVRIMVEGSDEKLVGEVMALLAEVIAREVSA
ncbi:MAG TPA: phosphoglucosamine mutase [Firmicutes bacterium]|nr:phosphoglucosamine mutase [Bacillota bacterium]